MQGRFITIEGGEGAGKSTQIRLLMAAFAEAGLPAVQTREPGGTDGAEKIRALLVRGDAEKWDDVTELLLFYAARREHVAKKIRPALAQGTHVICDRFSDSTRVYQGYGKRLGDDYVKTLHHFSLGSCTPDATLWLDIAPGDGLARAASRQETLETRFENMQVSFHARVQEGFRAIAAREPWRIARIDASTSIEAVHGRIIDELNARLGFLLKQQVT